MATISDQVALQIEKVGDLVYVHDDEVVQLLPDAPCDDLQYLRDHNVGFCNISVEFPF